MLQILLAFSLFLDKIILNLYLSLGFTFRYTCLRLTASSMPLMWEKVTQKKEKDSCNKK